ncbi:uncharacterized protein LOC127794717 [Diospyros lotus]|uniref:uncharacterized protein LOC127794717 n=1 Tax=Diospyros lotus TaxID=55363 RepID=UPI0022528B5A|nr:uncharacterized protein LOC127794717 [Diospyros lotus]
MKAKVEKEFQADVKSFSQMVPCTSRYPMEKQFQEVYTISKFKEFQDEFTGKMYCEVVSIEEGSLGTKHIVTILIRSGIRSLLDKYILRRWRKDVSRSYTRVKINYNSWISTPSQLRYDKLCSVFAKVADLVADDEDCTKATMEWMKSQLTALSISNAKPSCGSNTHVEDNVQEQVPDPGQATIASSGQIFYPKCLQTKGAPRKICKKGLLEMSSKKERKGPMETSSKKAKVGSSKVNQGNAPMQNIVEDGQAFSEGDGYGSTWMASIQDGFNHQ